MTASTTHTTALSSRIMTVLLAVSMGTFVAYAAYVALGVHGETIDLLFSRVLYNVGLAAAGLVCIIQGLRRESTRLAWCAIGVGILLWTSGNVYWAVYIFGNDAAPYPSPADALYLAFYLPTYVGLGLLIRSSHGRLPVAVWLDGLIAALVVAAGAIAIVFHQVLKSTGGEFAAVATNLMYPLADAVLLAFIVGLLAIGGWRMSRTWALLILGLGLFAIADSVYLYAIASGTYDVGSLVDLGWIGGVVLVGVAARQSSERRFAARREGWRVLLLPAFFALVAVVLVTVDHFHRLNTVALILVSLALGLVVVRLLLTFADHLRLLDRIHRDSVTDPLTGLWNRRALIADLEEATAARTPHVLALFDLDGFKSYNDTFGHPAGDALLQRVGAKLAERTQAQGRAYRLGGDEFCVLLRDHGSGQTLIDEAVLALEERGEQFAITASAGVVALPDEASSWGSAMNLADQRLYETKRSRPSAGRQIRHALLSALAERDAKLNGHLQEVAELAEAVGIGFDLEPDQVEQLRASAELHDVGKVAIPDSILFKPGLLDEEEMAFIRRHTLIGERIVSAVPALASVAGLIRSSHERWDGAGYPDGLARDEIPLASRIIAVCDAFTAMTEGRPYKAPMSVEAALEELERCAGTQFDPVVVAAFPAALAAVRERRGLAAAA